MVLILLAIRPLGNEIFIKEWIREILQSLQFKIIEPIVQLITVNVRNRISFWNLFIKGFPNKLTNTALSAID